MIDRAGLYFVDAKAPSGATAHYKPVRGYELEETVIGLVESEHRVQVYHMQHVSVSVQTRTTVTLGDCEET